MKGVGKAVLIIAGILAVLFVVLCVVSVFVAKSRGADLGQTINIKEENIDLTVLSSEKVTIEDETGLGIAAEVGDYLKVKVRIKNNNSEQYSWNIFTSFEIEDAGAVSAFDHGDDLPETIDAGQEAEGYLYFKYTDKSLMTYHTPWNAIDGDTAESKGYMFKIK